MVGAAIEPLLDIPRFVEAFAPLAPFEPVGESRLVYTQPGVRWRIQLERCSDIGYGLWRDDELGRAGVDGSELDRAAFGRALLEALEPQLSVHLLEGLAQTFAKAWATADAEVRRAIQARGGSPTLADDAHIEP